jgi:glycosyltransferase involved in cell wall biosynthesis
MTKLLVITDMDTNGSGYRNIAVSLLSGLSAKGYEIKVLGLSYRGQEHNFPFSILPTSNINDARYMAQNLAALWPADVLLVMLDIPLQNYFFQNLQRQYPDKYIAITPLENGPLCMSWAAQLINMKSVLFISELGRDEAQKAGLRNADYIQIGIDTEEWKLPIPEEKSQIRKGLGFDEDAFIVLTVADNQERKNLWAGFEIIKRLTKQANDKKIRHILVTREENEVGWRLKDLAASLGISQEVVIFKRGMTQKELWSLYSISDVYLSCSKAEGLGMPLLEAMACGIPVVGTDTGAIHELLDKKGFLIPPEYEFIDVWGNSKRSMVNIELAASALSTLMMTDRKATFLGENGRKYVESRTWPLAVSKLDETIQKVIDEQKKPQ